VIPTTEHRLAEQIRYYRVRAPEYDAWAERGGAYDRGAHNQGWHTEKQRLLTALTDFEASGDILEIAGGTGQWTERLIRGAGSLTVVDAAPEAVDENRRKLADDAGRVQYHVADFFDWDPPQQYDVVFFSYWLSHVPPERFEAFWERVARCLKPDGRVFVIDNIATAQAARLDPEIPAEADDAVLRPAPDGNLYRVWKVLWQPGELTRVLGDLGWSVSAYGTGTYFLWAVGHRTGPPA
jgi:2-polyprenyl-3-methyl-5-hydroxy-6-metoxy-1,4-benzoquinol methylase